MKILTCLREVPGRETRFRINQLGTWIEDSDITVEINECDEYALEEALRIKETHGGEVTVLSLGTERITKSIRKALAMGADRAIHIIDSKRRASSPYLIAASIAAVISGNEFDLILTGTQSDDMSYAQTGVILAEMLNLAHATIVMEIKADPQTGNVKALREMESGRFQWLELPLPALLAVQAGSSQVRYASLKGIMQAKKKKTLKVDIEQLQIDWDTLPSTELLRLYVPEASSKAEILEGDPSTVAATLLERLIKEAKIL
jgi:electron transfer flavoprotein beta subunit